MPPTMAMRCLRKRRQTNCPGVSASLASRLVMRSPEEADGSAIVGFSSHGKFLTQANAGIDDRVDHINDNREEHHGGGGDQQHTQHHRVIAALGVFPEQASHARPGEDRFGHQCAAQQEGNVEPDDR